MLHKMRLQMFARMAAQRRLYFWQTIWDQERVEAEIPTSGSFAPPRPAAAWEDELDPDEDELHFGPEPEP